MNKSDQLSALPRILIGILAAYGGYLHFSLDVDIWKNSFLSSIEDTGYLWQIIGVINLVTGILLIINLYTLLALLILLPITINIFLYHIFFYTSTGLYIGIPMIALNVFCLWQYRTHLKFLIQPKLIN
jgi:uncharacterized membrane protein YphA (DoxX/SURF4 family)